MSYRQAQHKLASNFIIDFFEELSDDLDRRIDPSLEIYLNWSRLGENSSEPDIKSIATALCESVCMVLVFTPTYFSKTHPYCAREYKAMEQLERKRMELLKKFGVDQPQELIIPIIFRGLDSIPEVIKKRKFYNFEDFLLDGSKISDYPNYKQYLQDIADHISKSYSQFKSIPQDLYNNCEDFNLPTEEETKLWLNKIADFSPSFPGRSKSGKTTLLFSNQ